MLIGPVLNAYVEAHGWQASYRALALFVAGTGVITYLLIPPDGPRRATTPHPVMQAGATYREILRAPAFWLLAASMALCNLPGTLLLTQLKMLVMDHGISGGEAAGMFTAMSGGMLAGRIVTGLALDRMPPERVAFIAMATPSLGLFLLGAPITDRELIALAVFLLGFAFGAEGDAMAYLIARHFPVAVYSSVMGLMTAVISASTASGAGLLSLAIARTGGFALFLNATGVAVACGAALLLGLRYCAVASSGDREEVPVSAALVPGLMD
jgi:predicted MFS family arabinose efflux permease